MSALKYQYKFTLIRIFNVYGPRMIGTKYGQVVPEFMTRIIQGEYPLKILGDGKHTRSFCYIDDHIELTYRLLSSKGVSNVVNLGNDEEISIGYLGEQCLKIFGKGSLIEFDLEGAREGDHRRRCPDLSLLRKIIGDFEFTPLQDGLELTKSYYEQKLSNDE